MYLLSDNDIKDIVVKLSNLKEKPQSIKSLKIPLRNVQQEVTSKFGSIEKLIKKHLANATSDYDKKNSVLSTL